MTTIFLDPTAESQPEARQLCPRPASVKGLTVGLLDISKARGDVFLNHLETLLTQQGAKVLRFTKPTFAKPAPVDLRQEIATQCDAVIEALADWGSCTTCSVHDINDFERRGIPAVFVASAPFVDAAEIQAQALGLEVARVFTAHPIQDRTDAEMHDLAKTALAELLEKITAQ